MRSLLSVSKEGQYYVVTFVERDNVGLLTLFMRPSYPSFKYQRTRTFVSADRRVWNERSSYGNAVIKDGPGLQAWLTSVSQGV